MMATEVLSFREDAEAIAYLREKGINPNQFAKEAFERTLRLAKLEESLAWFKAHPFNPVDKRPVEDIIREMRDTR
jgi:hypothetical protein